MSHEASTSRDIWILWLWVQIQPMPVSSPDVDGKVSNNLGVGIPPYVCPTLYTFAIAYSLSNIKQKEMKILSTWIIAAVWSWIIRVYNQKVKIDYIAWRCDWKSLSLAGNNF